MTLQEATNLYEEAERYVSNRIVFGKTDDYVNLERKAHEVFGTVNTWTVEWTIRDIYRRLAQEFVKVQEEVSRT